MTRLEALVALNMAGSIGSFRLGKLLELFASPQDIFKAPVEELTGLSAIGENLAVRIRSFKEQDLDKELKSAQKLDLEIVTFEDPGYPENLRNIPGAPIVLYVKGKITKEDNLAIGIVGSREASFYGLSNAVKFSAGLAIEGFTVVSGLARGIDTAAHRGALKAGGRTIAVLGSGFKNIYPPENAGLSEEIAQNGAVVSEFPLDEKPCRENFPRRNRIISGLSLGLLVAEAAKNSGALITADFALEQGREVFAFPGRIDSSNSFGANELIKQGAKLVSGVQDILEEFNLVSESAVKKQEPASPVLSNENENRIYELITRQAIPLDELIEKAGLDISRVSGILLSLQVRRLIRQLPGKQFVRSS